MILILDIISHSMSVSDMLYIFHDILPCLKKKILLDIGSRLGAVLYGVIISFSFFVINKCLLNKYIIIISY